MGTVAPEPGTRLGGRYRLADRVGASSGWAAWKATDETLARPVTVLTFVPEFPLIADVVTAARAASRLTDARLAQVFDVDEDPYHGYVVTEWVTGDSLNDLLADGPLEPGRGAEIIAESAEALAGAHDAGVAHLCLTPGAVRWAPENGVKIVGLGIDAALCGATADDPALADTRSLGRLLYAALTAHWPGGDWPSLPPAPEADGYPLSPRQVLAGVPGRIDEVCRRALPGGPGGPGGPPVDTPAALAAALNQLLPPPGIPPPAPAHLRLVTAPDPPPGGATAYRRPDEGPPRRSARDDSSWDRGAGGRGGRRPVANRVLASIATVLVIAAVGVGVWTLGHRGVTPARGSTPAHHVPAAPPVTVLTPVTARGFDPLSSLANDPGDENTNLAPLAVDRNPATAWHTQYYFGNPRFGGLKSGTGLILDMGKRVAVSSVTVTFGPVPGANVRIEVGDDDARAPATLGTFTTVAREAGVGGRVRFTARPAPEARFVLIWFTKLPPQTPGSTSRFEAEIYNVVVRGSP